MKTIKCLMHSREARGKPGSVLRFSDGSTKLVTQSGALVNCVRLPDGGVAKPVKLTKKERRRARLAAQVAQNQARHISPVKPASPDSQPLTNAA